MSDPDATQHAFEQLGAAYKNLATLLWAYYGALLEQGFTAEQAFALVRDFADLWVRKAVGG